MSNCFKLENIIDISNDKYIFNNNYETDISYGLYHDLSYIIYNIPKEYPIGFYNDNIDISHILTYSNIDISNIIIYVSKGNDLSYNNGDYFRFYDENFNLLNLNKNHNDNIGRTLTNSGDDFYFMKGVNYEFIATTDFSSSFPFGISGEKISNYYLYNIDDSFILFLSNDEFYGDIYYYDVSNYDISGEINILERQDFTYTINYYYGDIIVNVSSSYLDNSDVDISIKSYNHDISNQGIFYYSDECKYRSQGRNLSCLNIVSEISFNNFGFGVYDGYYILYNIDDPIRVQIDFSNNVYIDNNYQYTNIKFEDSIITYSNAIKIIIDNSNNILLNNDRVLTITDISNDISFNLKYLDRCQDSNIIINPNPLLYLYNQQDVSYDNTSYLLEKNIYTLDYNKPYLPPIIPYSIIDKYGNDISNLVRDQSTNNFINNSEYTDISYIIIYSVTDYEGNEYINYRLIKIHNGPFIDISINNIFKNDNNLNNIIEYDSDRSITIDIDNSLNFIDDIDVYIYDICDNKITLPFSIEITGNYYNSSSTYNNPILHNDLSLNYKQSENIEYNSLKYYLSRNISLTANLGLILKNVDFSDNKYSINETSSILSENNLYIKDTTNNRIRLNIGNNGIEITDIDNSNSIIYLKQTYGNFDLSTSLQILENNKFIINFIDNNNEGNNTTICGEFLNNKFFSNETSKNDFINPDYIGNYNLKIIVKGLDTNDYLYNLYDSSLNSFVSDFSRSININIIDTKPPIINFFENTDLKTQYEYSFPKTEIFNIINDVDFYIIDSNRIQINSNKPYIEFSDNTIYDVTLSYEIIFDSENISKTNNDLSVNATEDISCIINYKGIDLCGNISTDISLVLTFKDIPFLELSGNKEVTIEALDGQYKDQGIIIDNTYITYSELVFTDVSSGIINYNDNNNINIDISYSTDLSLNKIGRYSIIYDISNEISQYENSIKRFINVEKTTKPYFILPDLSFIITDSNYDILCDISYSIESSNNNVDICFQVFTSSNTFKNVIENVDLCDNYFPNLSLIKTINIDDSGELLDFSDNNFTDFTNYNQLSDRDELNRVTFGLDKILPIKIKYKVIDPCDNSFEFNRIINIIDDTPPTITFNYNDSNYYNNPHYDYSYVIFDNSFIDFSYQAINHNKVDIFSNFKNELENILFDFVIQDNYNTFDEIEDNYTITISSDLLDSNITNIKNIQDVIVDNSLCNLFKEIDLSFEIIYDFSDNQYNETREIRKIKIINTIKPEVEFTDLSNKYRLNNNILTISFGDLGFDIEDYITYKHKRVLNTDISFDISYNIINSSITSVSGNVIFDISGLVYNTSQNLIDISVHVNFLNNSDIITISSEIDILGINIDIYPPIISFSGDLFYEAGESIPDASFIFNVSSYSIYDHFYYYHNYEDISYTETPFSISFDETFDQFTPSVGNYDIIYIATDHSNNTTEIIRNIEIKDTKPPLIELIGLSTISFEQYSLINYTDDGISGYDIGSDISYYIIEISNNSNIIYSRQESINNKNLLDTDIDISNTISTDICGNKYSIIYTLYDSYDNSSQIIREINIIKSNNFLYDNKLSINLQDNPDILNLNQDGSYNDSSFNISYSLNTNTITYEATNNDLFSKINFTSDILFNGNQIDNDSISITNNIISNVIGSYNIYIVVFINENGVFNIDSQLIKFNVVDTTIPNLSFIENDSIIYVNNSDSDSESILKVPILHPYVYGEISNNILSYFDFNNNYNYFTRSNYDPSNNIIYNLPGVLLNDIVDGSLISLSNETLNNEDIDKYTLDISYDNSIYDDNFNFFTNSGEITTTQTFTFTSNTNQDLSASISRTLKQVYFKPIINLTHQTDSNNNKYYKYYHEQGKNYIDNYGIILDYYDISLSFDISNIVNNNVINQIREQPGIYNIEYTSTNSNSLSTNVLREVNSINIQCFTKNILNFNEKLNNYDLSNNLHYGVYGNEYDIGYYYFSINSDSSENAIMLFGYNGETNNVHDIIDISNLIELDSTETFTISGETYYYGDISLIVYDNFNRASIKKYNSERYIDFIIYSETCNSLIVNLEDSYDITQEFQVDVSRISFYDQHDTSKNKLKFKITDNSNNNKNISLDNSLNTILYLPFGKYKFNQNTYLNFYNQINFSLTEDGTHNFGSEYKKNVVRKSLASLSESFTTIIIDITTPSPLYFYSKNFPNMGGKIIIKNNIVLHKNIIGLNGCVLSNKTKNIDGSFSLIDISNGDINNLKNKVYLSIKFDLSNNINDLIIKKNFIGITHQNINHNISQDIENSKIVFHKYYSVSDSSNIKHDISDIYLSIDELNNIDLYDKSFKTNILYYKYEKININDLDLFSSTDNYTYDFNVKETFYSGSELDLYNYFFYKNNLINSELFPNYFIYKINELAYINSVKLIDGIDSEYNFYQNKYFNYDNIKFSSIFDNILTFTMQIYLDVSFLDINTSLLNHLINSYFNNTTINNPNRNYDVDNNNLLFNEYIVNIYSDIPLQDITPTDTPKMGIIFNKETINNIDFLNIELNDNLIDSSYSSDLIDKITDNYQQSENIIKDTVFLSIKPNDDNDTSYNYIGLTEQNLFHNMFIDENNNVIFHKYNNLINNYQVNTEDLTLEKTIDLSVNNNKYLIEISNNDIYGCFGDLSNIYDNYRSKNRFLNDISDISSVINENNTYQNDFSLNEYKTFIRYFVDNELELSNNLLEALNIKPMNLNNIDYTTYTSAYPLELQEAHSHSYLIDLNKYFDRKLYNTSNRTMYDDNISKLPINNINYDYLYYKIIDISYTRDFNIFDVCNNLPIIYDTTKILLLNELQDTINGVNLDLDYIYIMATIIYKERFIDISNIENLNNSEFILINSINIQNLQELFNTINFSYSFYTIKVGENNLNQLYSNCFYNIRKINEKYIFLYNILDKAGINFNNTEDVEYIDILGYYNSIFNKDIVNRMENDVQLLKTNINYMLQILYSSINIPKENIEQEIWTTDTENMYNNSYIDFNNNVSYNFKSYEDLCGNLMIKFIYYDISSGENRIINDISTSEITIYDLSNIKQASKNYNEIRNTINILINSINLYLADERDTYNLLNNVEIYNIYDYVSIGEFYIKLIIAYYSVYNFFINYDEMFPFNPTGFSSNDISNNMKDFYNVFSFGDDYNDNSYNWLNFYTSYNNISDNLNNFNIVTDFVFDTNINYAMGGSSILINSYDSNNILIKYEIYYNSFLFPNYYLDTNVLDMCIPDFTPPTLIFEDEKIEIVQSLTVSDTIEILIDILLDNVKYIDENIENIVDSFGNSNLDIKYSYIDLFTNKSDTSYNNTYHSIIEIDLSNLYNATFGTLESIETEVIYKVKDKANNVNFVHRPITLLKSVQGPIFYYLNEPQGIKLNVPINLKIGESLTNKKIYENIKAFDVSNNNEDLTSEITYILDSTFDSNIENTYTIIYSVTSNKFGLTSELLRDIIVESKTKEKSKVCCYPKVFYKEIQHSYKLGSQNSTAMKLAKIIVNNIR